ncbi:cell division protein FtsQ/DivIB [Planctomicrobium sp. SH668]|uniref:cell division protein FtsQ/DivIB n=1 Tax=Planctomicrobium sp. SH668 TaxID=3448126 RepID=UPI003F5B3417
MVNPEPAVVQPSRSKWRFLVTLAFLVAVCGLGIGIARIIPDVSNRPEYQFGLQQLRLTPPHPWIPSTIIDEVRELSQLPETVSLLQPGLSEQLALAWQKHPWVKQVNSVEITPAPGIVVDVEYRIPAAFIESRNAFYPVDTEGNLLPSADFSHPSKQTLPIVLDSDSDPQGRVGEPWGNATVTAAASLAAALAPSGDTAVHWNRLGFKAIIIPPTNSPDTDPSQLTFEIETKGGNRIVWGKSPGFDALEPTPDEKIARLNDFQSKNGSLDGVSGRHRIDIRLFDVYSLQPLDDVKYR